MIMQNLLPSSESDRDRYLPEQLRRRFSNRQRLIQAFERSLNLSPPVPVLMFHGIGGIGKTAGQALTLEKAIALATSQTSEVSEA